MPPMVFVGRLPALVFAVLVRCVKDIQKMLKEKANMPICGEAFCDFQGFMEGALRSAHSALAKALGKNAGFSLKSHWESGTSKSSGACGSALTSCVRPFFTKNLGCDTLSP